MPSPADHHDSPSLVGRDRELALLRAALDAALVGRGSLVLIGGEAGIGKTALAEQLLAEAVVQGALALVGRCYDLSETPPYGPWAEALVRLPGTDSVPALLGASDPVGSQAALFARVHRALADATGHGPLVLLLEDLHWADPASLDLLRAVARDLADLPLLLLVTYRADEIEQVHPLFALLPLLVREARAERIDLRPLDRDAIDALVAERYALASPDADRLTGYLAGRSEGNALFLGELLRTLEGEGLLRREGNLWAIGDLAATPVPMLLRQVIARRGARLTPETQRLLAVAAVIGQEVPLETWAAVAEVGEDDLLAHAERALTMRLLAETPDGAGVRFTHALIREALYAEMPAMRRRGWHRRVGEILAVGPGPDPDAVAYHLQRAGDPRAAAWLVRAGERAQRTYAWLTAAGHYEAAVALLEGQEASAGQRALLLITLAQLRRYDSPGRCVELLAQAARLATAAGDDALAACACFDQGHLRCAALDFRQGIAQMAAALPALEALAPTERHRLPALLLQGAAAGEHYHRSVLMVQLARAGRFADARGLGETLPTSGPGASARGLFAQGLVHAACGRPAEARQSFAAARAIYRAADHHAEVAITLNYELATAILPYRADQPEERRRLAGEAAMAWARARGAGGLGLVRRDSPLLLFLEGHWAALRKLDRQEANEPVLALALGLMACEQGDAALAGVATRRSFPDGLAAELIGSEWSVSCRVQRIAATMALAAGDLPTARAWLEAHDEWLAWSGATLGQADGHLGWAAYHRASGDAARARQRADLALAQATAPRQPLALLAAHRLLGELDTAGGRHAGAAGHLDAALALAETCAAPYERALTLLALAESRHAEGQHAAAQAMLDEARATFVHLGARPALARCDALTAQLSGESSTSAAIPAPPPSAAPYPARLTAREVEVLRLIAAGQSNREMAEVLCRSERTVERHIENIYRKVGAHSKADATAFAFRHGLA